MGAGPAGPSQGKGVERPDKLSQHHFLFFFLLPPHHFLSSPLPQFVSLPSCPHMEPCGIQYGGRDLQGAWGVSHTRMSKRHVCHQLEHSGLELKCGKKLRILFHSFYDLSPSSVAILAITNKKNISAEEISGLD